MSRPGPWHRARNPGLSDPEQGVGLMGVPTGPGIQLTNPNIGDMWGAGARYNFRQRWQDQQGNFVNPESGEILDNWFTGHGSGRYSVPDRQNVNRVDNSRPAPGGGNPIGGYHTFNNGGGSGAPGDPRWSEMGSQLGGNNGMQGLTGYGGQTASPGGQGGDQSAMFPWLQRWTGGTQAPLSPYEQQGLTGISNFVGGGMGLDSSHANSYLNNIIGGGMLDQNNPYFDQIEQHGQQLLSQSQDRTLREMQSRAAAGGNALSGALMQGEGDYLQGSNAAFQGTMSQMRADQYARERGMQQQAVGMQNDMQNQNAQTQMGGYGSLMGWGATPRNIQTNEMQGQYADWLRQITNMRDQYQYPDQMMMGMLGHGYQESYRPQFGDSSAGQLSSLFSLLGQNGGAGIDWGGIIGGIGGLFGGGSGEQPQDQQNDGHLVSYDGVNPAAGPKSYQDSDYYNKALTAEQQKASAAATPKDPHAAANAGIGSATLLIQFLNMLFGHGGGGNGKSKGGVNFGGGQGGSGSGNRSGKSLWDSIFGKKDPTHYTNQFDNHTPHGGNLYQDPIGPGLSEGGDDATYWQPPVIDDSGSGVNPWDSMGQNPNIPDSGGDATYWSPETPDWGGGGYSDGGDNYDFGT